MIHEQVRQAGADLVVGQIPGFGYYVRAVVFRRSRAPFDGGRLVTDRLRWFVGRSCSLASLAYAARMKRLGHSYFIAVVAALYSGSDDPCLVYDGWMPSTVRSESGARAVALLS